MKTIKSTDSNFHLSLGRQAWVMISDLRILQEPEDPTGRRQLKPGWSLFVFWVDCRVFL